MVWLVHVPSPCRHMSTHHQPGPPQYSCAHSWPWPLPLCVCLQQGPTTTQAPTVGPCSQACAYHQLWPPLLPALVLAAKPRGTAKNPASLCNHCRPLTALAKNHTVDVVGPSCLNQQDTMYLGTQSHHLLSDLALCTTRHRATAHSSMSSPTGEGLPLLKSVHKIWKR